MVRLLTMLVLGTVSSQAQTITETFGSGANQFSIDFVEIGNPGNPAYRSVFGAVSYTFNLGKYEISRDMIDKANAASGLGITMYDMASFGGNGPNRPATGINWFEAARFINWLNSTKGYREAYKFNSSGNFQMWGLGDYSGNNPFRHKDAYYWLPSTDEMYKGAYYDPNKAGGAGYWLYPTGSDNEPAGVSGGSFADTVVVGPGLSGPADISNAGGLSPFGTMAQGGNVSEWTETAFDFINDDALDLRRLGGGSFYGTGISSENIFNGALSPTQEFANVGFRVASVPEPSSLSLLLVGGAVLMAGRRKKQD